MSGVWAFAILLGATVDVWPTGVDDCMAGPNPIYALVYPQPSRLPIDSETFCEKKHSGNRYGVPIVYVRGAGGWLQYQMVHGGEAMVLSQGGESAGLAQLLAAEDEARAAGRGIWADDNSPLADAATAAERVGEVLIVRARVLSTGKSKDRYFLNFGEDWRRDLTAEIPRKRARAIKFKSEDYEGRLVEIRGHVDEKGGPRIIITRPGQIRLAD